LQRYENKIIPKCLKCKIGLVKPDITFFGENLPSEFWENLNCLDQCDLLIVIGTSLAVYPFRELINLPNCQRYFINFEKLSLDTNYDDDCHIVGDCQDIFKELKNYFD
jgi:NAD+-dependent protein deacetylase SIR2